MKSKYYFYKTKFIYLNTLKEIFETDQYKNIEFIANQVVEGFITGLHRSPYHGFSVEFAEHRAYNTGENTKFIDWKLFGKTEKLFVKRFEEETNLRCHIIIDTSSSMLFPFNSDINKLNFSVFSAAALINLFKRQRDAIGLSLFSEELDFHINSKLSKSQISLVYSELENCIKKENQKKNKKTNAAKIINEIAEIVHQRSLVIIFSDMLVSENSDKLFDALQHLRFKQHEIILFHLRDKQHELDFDFANRPYKFIDLETEKEVKLTPTEIGENIRAKFQEYFNEIKLKSGQNKIHFIEADINQNFNQVLLPYLNNRNKM